MEQQVAMKARRARGRISNYVSARDAEIIRRRGQAVEQVVAETWTPSMRGVECNAERGAHLKHCAPGAPVDPLVSAARERVASVAPEGVRLARALLELRSGDKEGLLKLQGMAALLLKHAEVPAQTVVS
jgi:hypothetical protein